MQQPSTVENREQKECEVLLDILFAAKRSVQPHVSLRLLASVGWNLGSSEYVLPLGSVEETTKLSLTPKLGRTSL